MSGRSEFELIVLGGSPPEAAAAWQSLSEEEKAKVLDTMASNYGSDFAQAFVVTPTDLAHDYDTIRNIAPSNLEAQGFRYARDEGHEQIWFHPSGRTFHLKVGFEGGEAEEPSVVGAGEGQASEGSITQAAHDWADHLGQSAANLPDELTRCESLIGQPGYAECYNDLIASWNGLDNDLTSARGNFDTWRGEVSDDELADLEAEIDRIEQTREWRDGYSSEFWPRVGQLPQP